MDEHLTALGITFQGTWSTTLKDNLEKALYEHIGKDNLKAWFNNKPVILSFGGPAKLGPRRYSGLTQRHKVTFFANGTTNPITNILHELGHLFDNVWDDFFTGELQKESFHLGGGQLVGWDGKKYIGLPADEIRAKVLKARSFAGSDVWQQRGGTPHFEDWADIFSNAMLKNIDEKNEVGRQLLTFVARMEAHIKVANPSGGGGTLPPPPPPPPVKENFDTKALPAVTPTLAIHITGPGLNIRSNTNVSGSSPSGAIVGSASPNTKHQVFEVVRVNDRIWARVGTNKWAVVEKRDGTVFAEFVQTGTPPPPPPPPPPVSSDPFDTKILPTVTGTLAIRILTGALNLRRTIETRNGLPSGPTNGSVLQATTHKVFEVVRIEDRIWARVGIEQWAVVEKRDGTVYAAFTNI